MRGPVTSSRTRRNPPPRPGRCARGRGRGHVRRPAQGQAGQPWPPGRFTSRKLYPGLRCPNGPPHLKSWGQGLLPSGPHPGLREQRIPGVGALHNAGGWGKKVSRLNKEPEGGDSRAPPLPRSPAPEAPLAGVQPLSLPHAHRLRLLGTKPECRRPRFHKALAARLSRSGSGGGQKIQPVPCPDNTRPCPIPQLCGDEELSIQNPSQRAPCDKMGGGGAHQRTASSFLDTARIPSASLRPRVPTAPGLRGRTGTAPQAEGWPL